MITTDTNKVIYVSDGTTTEYDFSFTVYDKSYLKVYIQSPDTNEPATLEEANYNVVLNEDYSGGKIILNNPLSQNTKISIIREVDKTQETHYIEGGPFPAQSHERALDKLTMITQQLDEKILRIPQGSIFDNSIDFDDLYNSIQYCSNNIEALAKSISMTVNTIKDLIAIDTTNLTDKTAVLVLGYHEPNDGGGGVFYWDTQQDKSNHNAATIVDPTAIFPTDWTNQTQLTTWFNSANTGNGCWIRQYDGDVDINWFGSKDDGTTDNSISIQKTLDYCSTNNLDLTAMGGTYLCGGLQNNSVNMIGTATLKAISGATEIINLGHDSGWFKKSIKNLTFDGNGKASNGIVFSQPTDTELAGRWTFYNVQITDCDIGLYKPNGNIGNEYRACNFIGCNYAYKAIGSSSPLMHAGADLFYGGNFSGNNICGIYINSPIGGTGQTVLNGTVIEGNQGFGIFVANYETSYTPLEIDNVWFEDNATASSVTISSVDYVPQDIQLMNTALCVMNSITIKKVNVISSNVVLDACFVDDTSVISKDTNSTVKLDNMHTDKFYSNSLVKTVSKVNRINATQIQPRFFHTTSNIYNSTLIVGETFADATTYTFSGTSTVTGNQVAGGIIFDNCCDVSIPASSTEIYDIGNITVGKYYVWSLDAKLISGNLTSISIVYDVTLVYDFNNLLEEGVWKSMGGVGDASYSASGDVKLYMVNNSSSSVEIYLSALQVVEFNTESDAINYFNNNLFLTQ